MPNDNEIPAPVPSGHVNGYSVADFDAPCIMPNIGIVRMESFIATKTAFEYYYGNDRSFNPLFDPLDTKASILLDFTKGEAQVITDPTCHVEALINHVTGKHISYTMGCAHSYPLSGTKSDNVNWFRWKVDPSLPGFPPKTEFLTIQYAFKLPTFRADAKFALPIIPAINGLIHFAFEPDTGDVCLNGTIDAFPAVAVHQVHYDTNGNVTSAITLARHLESGVGALRLVPAFPRTQISNQCGQNLTSSPANFLAGVDWTKVITATELGCNGPTGPNLGVLVDAKQFADVTGDGKAEAFVAVACVGSTESWPDRLEVFDGASDPAHPRRIATLLDYQDGTDGPHGLGLRVQSIKFPEKHIVVVSKGWLTGECFACGDQQVIDTFVWNGSGFTRGLRYVTQIS